MPYLLVGAFAGAVLAVTPTASAGTLVGKIELPSSLPHRPPPGANGAPKGFLDRTENPVTPVRTINVTQRMIVVVDGGDTPVAPPRVQWNLIGESFAHAVIAAAAGAEVTIVNQSKSSRTLVAKEDPKLIEAGPINPTGNKTFHGTVVGKVYTIVDKDAPHLVGKVVIVGTQFIAYPDDAGHFEIENIPPGSYKLKLWYGDGWLQRPDDTVEIGAKGKADFNPKVPAGAFGVDKE
jgi:Polysaccharide lyase family 4, domain II